MLSDELKLINYETFKSNYSVNEFLSVELTRQSQNCIINKIHKLSIKFTLYFSAPPCFSYMFHDIYRETTLNVTCFGGGGLSALKP
jgi:hypothetical protein